WDRVDHSDRAQLSQPSLRLPPRPTEFATATNHRRTSSPARSPPVRSAALTCTHPDDGQCVRRLDRGAGSRQTGRVHLPVMPPVARMLAKPIGDIPAGQLYEPKWDGFRSIIFRDGDEVEIGSRNERPMTRYFPEIVEAVLAEFPERAVVDGEI